ncbi:hypothetical protein GDO78_023194 [Eleutherodactylus coqui]|uniref:Uncharacterized protein n=1 Tax=Eleutherodactylus coqui TaxID=57060 RepID=A0A8J6E555_ELECQ|nr:hypothetical protein GDO78_023194 [Eleutherodactylus coqui]
MQQPLVCQPLQQGRYTKPDPAYPVLGSACRGQHTRGRYVDTGFCRRGHYTDTRLLPTRASTLGPPPHQTRPSRPRSPETGGTRRIPQKPKSSFPTLREESCCPTPNM